MHLCVCHFKTWADASENAHPCAVPPPDTLVWHLAAVSTVAYNTDNVKGNVALTAPECDRFSGLRLCMRRTGNRHLLPS